MRWFPSVAGYFWARKSHTCAGAVSLSSWSGWRSSPGRSGGWRNDCDLDFVQPHLDCARHFCDRPASFEKGNGVNRPHEESAARSYSFPSQWDFVDDYLVFSHPWVTAKV